jgi:protein-S-isoprenylcysteine O-methyltransferase Ste14
LRPRPAAASIRRTSPWTIVTDTLLVAAWLVLLIDGVRLSARERLSRRTLGPIVAGRAAPPAWARVTLAAGLVAGVLALEETAGRWPFRPGLALAGLAVAAAGVVLHGRARRALGAYWLPTVGVRAGHALVDHGPYAVVRHPLYLGAWLLAAGTVAAHPSLATACLATGLTIGIGLKIVREERLLRRIFGDDWSRYSRRVPAVLPRLTRGGRPR